jgi:glycerol-3-phosphate O-acyltransferase
LSYSKYNIKKNVNSIFFPGGTRSRSGEIETNLKIGLMGSLLEAQFDRVKNKEDNVFVIPIVLNYHSVLEAKPLIYSYLKSIGRKKFISRTKTMVKRSKPIGIFKSVYRILAKKSEFVFSIGKPMDVFGNPVDIDGNSIDSNGNKIDISDYFKREGELVKDAQRDIVYTKMLAKKIADSYLTYNVILSSHIVSFVLFNIMLESLEIEDVFELFKYNEKEVSIEYNVFKKRIKELLGQLTIMKDNEQVILSDEFELSIDELIDVGIKKLGVYHDEKVIFMNKEGSLKTENFGLLFYYANRLSFLKSLRN